MFQVFGFSLEAVARPWTPAVDASDASRTEFEMWAVTSYDDIVVGGSKKVSPLGISSNWHHSSDYCKLKSGFTLVFGAFAEVQGRQSQFLRELGTR